jgi:hypothetical protein
MFIRIDSSAEVAPWGLPGQTARAAYGCSGASMPSTVISDVPEERCKSEGAVMHVGLDRDSRHQSENAHAQLRPFVVLQDLVVPDGAVRDCLFVMVCLFRRG